MIRKAVPSDREAILSVYAAARETMRQSGNPNQWGTQKPEPALIDCDLARGQSYVEETDGHIGGVFALVPGDDPTYAVIDGAWIDDAPYSTLHRVASDGSSKGFFRRCIAFCDTVTDTLRIDTHRDNRIMRRVIEAEGFSYCGVITIADGTPRMAYIRKRPARRTAMRYFLTSSLCLDRQPQIDPANGLTERLCSVLPKPTRCVFVCSDPDVHERTVFFGNEIRTAFEREGVSFASFDVLDGRNEADAAALIGAADLIVLAGGHVPTQNRFLQRIGLKALLQGFSGTVVGISAGSMNCAETVYAQPEEPGEATDPAYRRFLPGLGLTRVMLLPHYQINCGEVLDGLRVYRDIACPDSIGRQFWAIPDGSYLYGDGSGELLCGEAYVIENGAMRKVQAAGDVRRMEE